MFVTINFGPKYLTFNEGIGELLTSTKVSFLLLTKTILEFP